MSLISRPLDIRLPQLAPDARVEDRVLLQALYDQFRDTNQRLWALETTLGTAPRKAADTYLASGVTAASYTYSALTVGTDGRITAASSGSAPFLFGQCTTLASIAATVTTYFVPGQITASATEANRQIVVPAMTVSKLYWNAPSANNAAGHDGSVVMTLRKNGANTSITATIADNGAAGVYSDTAHSVTFAAGDLLSISIANNNTTAAYAFTNSSVALVLS